MQLVDAIAICNPAGPAHQLVVELAGPAHQLAGEHAGPAHQLAGEPAGHAHQLAGEENLPTGGEDGEVEYQDVVGEEDSDQVDTDNDMELDVAGIQQQVCQNSALLDYHAHELCQNYI